jgi:endonuclease/exonuclease/phosphatase family metal-dependent hydrolase
MTINKKKICIINTHLQSTFTTRINKYSLLQWNEIYSFIKNINVPWIIGGDFNMNYNHLEKNINFPIYKSLTPTIYIKYENEKEVDTSSIPKPQYEGFIFDYFITNQITLNVPHVINFKYSDHLPVSSSFYIN